ncbi:MAG: GAF domain-containing protein [Planctomycetes bacterium]|nr:GAF domain-containing protein [Planctomycetota bacterium]
MPKLSIKAGSNQGQVQVLGQEPVTIGRARTCAVRLTDFDVSREHSQVVPHQEGGKTYYTVKDLGSKNGTAVNGVTIAAETVLKDADEIKIGSTVLAFQADGAPTAPSGTAQRSTARQAKTFSSMDEALAGGARGALPTGSNTFIDVRDRSLLAAGSVADAGKLSEGERAVLRVRRNISVIREVAETVITLHDLTQILQTIMDLVFKIVGPDQGFIMLAHEQTGQLEPKVHRDRRGPRDLASITVSRTILDMAVEKHVAVLAPDITSDDRFSEALSIVQYNFKSAICVPLVSKDKLQGVLQVHNRVNSGDLTEESLEFLTIICNLAAVAIENARLYRNVQDEVRKRTTLSRYFSPHVVENLMAAGSAAEGGKKEVATIIESDIRGFTRMSETMDPAAVVRLLNEYFSEMVAVVFENDGNIDKFMGDAILAYFGGLAPSRDDAYRAVRTAIDWQRRLVALNERWASERRPRVQIGVGVHTGLPMIGNIGSEQRREFTIIGDAVNLTSRLCGLAQAEQVVISKDTALALEGAFPLRPLEPVQVKNRAQPVEVFEVLWRDEG